MQNINFILALRSMFSALIAVFSTAERVANTLDNTAKLGEVYTGGLVKEQELIQAKRIADLEDKVATKYEAEKKQWNI